MKSKPCMLALEAINSEEEPEGPMPDNIWEEIKNDREAIEEMIRAAVRATKNSIRDRYLESFDAVRH